MKRLGLIACLGLAALPVAMGQEQDPNWRPSNEQLDQDLDRTLRKEYEGEGEAPPGGAQARPVEPIPDYAAREKEKEDDFELRLGGIAAHYYTVLRRVEVSYREGTSGGQTVKVTEDQAIADFDPIHAQTYQGWIDLGRWVGLSGGFRRGVYRDTQASATTFTFGRTTFGQGQVVDTKVEVMTADLDFVVKPLNNEWVTLDLHFGARYMFWETQFTAVNNSPLPPQSSERLEAAIPMVGIGLEVRPVSPLRLFARARIGHLSYDRDSYYYEDRRDRIHYVESKERTATSVELDAGVALVLFDSIGVVAGYRLDYLHIERVVDQRAAESEGVAHGVYAGLYLEF